MSTSLVMSTSTKTYVDEQFFGVLIVDCKSGRTNLSFPAMSPRHDSRWHLIHSIDLSIK